MENEQNNPSNIENNQVTQPFTPVAPQPIGDKNVLVLKMAKISLYTFISSSAFLALFGTIGIWTNNTTTLSRLEGTFGIITGLSFIAIIGIRITVGKKK